MSEKSKWLIFSISGLILVGAGLSIFGEALRLKLQINPHFWSWFSLGTLSLILVNAGLSFIGQAVIFKCRWERKKSSGR